MSSVAASTPGGAAQAPHKGVITASVMLASIMQSLDITIANVALPHVQGTLSATQDQMTWVLTSYIVASAIMMPLGGWLAGQFGRRRIFLASIAGFTVSSVFCGLAQSLPEIVVARLLQGISGAALVPLSQATLLDINPPSRHARAMAMWMMGVVAGPVFGPMLGGWLTEHYSWRWVFYINVPFGIAAFAGVYFYLPETAMRRSRFDLFGFLSLSIAVGAFQLLMDRGQGEGWFDSTEIWCEAVVAGLALYLFVVHMFTAREHPFISPALFRDRNFLTGNLFIFVVGVVLFATLALLPPLLQTLLQYPVLLSGMITAPRGLGTIAATFIAGRLMGRIDTRLIIATGLGITAWSLWLMSGMSLSMDSSLVFWSGILQGFGTGFVYAPLAVVAFATLPAQYRNEGTAMFSLIRNLGSSVGISMVIALLVQNTRIMHSRLGEHVTPYGDGLNGLSWQMLGDPASLARLDALTTAQSAMIAYNNDFHFMMILTLCMLPLVPLLRTASTGRKPPAALAETKK